MNFLQLSTTYVSPSAFLPRHPYGFQNLGSSSTFKLSKKERRCIRKAGPTKITATFDLKPPPYPLNALEPIMSQETLEYHWGKHHRTYVDNLNKQIIGTDLDGKSLEDIIVIAYNKGDFLPAFNNAAQAWNHDFFWESMKPGGGGKPSGDLLKLIERDFGSFEKFLDKFKIAASTQFGSGWAWLAYKESRLDVGNAVNPLKTDEDNKLVVVKSPNAVNPLVWGYYYPLLTIDVWEHAYYLDYQNRRPDYISVFMDKLVSWEAVSSRLEQAKALVAEREREDERKRIEEEKWTSSQATPEIYPDGDAELGGK
ncbi:superoxide dismutase [Fe], chloroplastic-like [Gastrolobium bilobum]|uniref:superoxide dismutase [Fe], chloroplastic-like n=1 Tax=Gastrolobium bilobum TaxID=150636 RepID=UPI002AB29C4B|nr:superoxide dismutase [Fe], chloroplastic-like [Gastrolobium bilobum]